MVFLTILIALVCFLLMIVVLIQNPKGGGLDSTFGGAGNQMFGAAKSSDFIEKATWGLTIALFVLCLTVSWFLNASGAATGPELDSTGSLIIETVRYFM